jgi:hypothetical protein
MKKNIFIGLFVLISSLGFGQRKISNNHELLFRKGGFLVAQLEKVSYKDAKYYRQFIIKNKDNEVVLIINKKFTRFDSLKTKTNPAGYLNYLEFVFIDSLLRGQVLCTEKQGNDLNFVKSLIIALCDSFPGGDGGPPTYGLNYAWVKEFIKKNPVKYF